MTCCDKCALIGLVLMCLELGDDSPVHWAIHLSGPVAGITLR